MATKTLENKIYHFLNRCSPKFNKVLVIGDSKIESNALEVANFIKSNYNIPVYYIVDKDFRSYAEQLLLPGVILVSYPSLFYRLIHLTSRYIFSTHGSSLAGTSKKQLFVNVWHGVGHKKIRKARGELGLPADVTLATSELTKKVFAESFDVDPSSIFISGYPRNDLMLRTKTERSAMQKRMVPDLSSYKKVMIWMPTFRRKASGGILRDGLEKDNPFQVEGFDDVRFNNLLVAQNVLCLVKPHYYASKNSEFKKLSNILTIDGEWIAKQGIGLYELLACTDILVTDFSSVMMDYLLLDQPVICFSTDLEGYKSTQGLYYEDLENWLPTELIQDHEEFFRFTESLLSTGIDPHISKRESMKDLFFQYKDAHSTKRLVEHVFSIKV